ncbi:MAG TPA: M23 family metallopeptidase [Vitreimonas sp.]|nr:M23 family metallopeptidase [Vitreimonas sp.]
MPRRRQVRLVFLAVPFALWFAFAPRAFEAGPPAPAVVEAAVGNPVLPAERRSEGWVPKPDPDGRRGETGVARPPGPAALTGYVWPLPGARLTLPFEHTHWGSRLVDGERFHDGIDLATFCGDRVLAAHDGVVLAAGRQYDRYMGWQGDLEPYFARLDEKNAWLSLPIVVVIDDGNRYRSIYAHFSKVVVKPGDTVTAGQLIGYEGRTGRASGCHLHYGLFSPEETAVFEIREDVVEKLLVPRYQTARVDPLLVLPRPPEPDAPRDGWRPVGRPSISVPPVKPDLEAP